MGHPFLPPRHDPWPHWRSSAAGASLKSRQSCCRVQCLDVRFARPVRMSPYGELYSRCRTFVRGASAGHRRGCSSAADRSNAPHVFRFQSCHARSPSAVLHSARRTQTRCLRVPVVFFCLRLRLSCWEITGFVRTLARMLADMILHIVRLLMATVCVTEFLAAPPNACAQRPLPPVFGCLASRIVLLILLSSFRPE